MVLSNWGRNAETRMYCNDSGAAGDPAAPGAGGRRARSNRERVEVQQAPYEPGKIEAGIFLGGFISNYYHQFYDPDLFPTNRGPGNTRKSSTA